MREVASGLMFDVEDTSIEGSVLALELIDYHDEIWEMSDGEEVIFDD